MNSDDDTPQKRLFSAILHNDIVTASSLIANGVIDGNPPPLSVAARHNRLEIMARLLDAGAPINAVDMNLQTACHKAISYDSLPALELLIARGADLDVVNARGQSLLACSIHNDDARFAIALLDAGVSLEHESQSRLVDLAAKSTALVLRLLARNVDVGALRDTDFNTPCHWAIMNDPGNVDIVRTLISVARCDPNAASVRGLTPCMNAVINDNAAMLRVLIELGADVNRCNTDGWTALHLACDANALDATACVDLLVAAGCDCRFAIGTGDTAGHIAVAHDSVDVLCTLLAGGADFEQADNNNVTIRQFATNCQCPLPTDDEIGAARLRIARMRLDFVRHRALQTCIGLQAFDLPALQLCEIMLHACGPVAPLVPFHQWWKIATTVKHFHKGSVVKTK
jgi:ankyrin repeat protein